MSAFTEQVWIIPIPKTWIWVVSRPLTRYLDYETKWRPITVEPWFQFDWASTQQSIFAVMAILASFVSPWFLIMAVLGYFVPSVEPCSISAAALHDYLYIFRPYNMTQRQADRIFREALIACWTPKWKAWVMRAWVATFGRIYRHKIPSKIRAFTIKYF